MIPISLGDTDDPCAADTSLWVTVKSLENGKCFSVCSADPAQMFEVACPAIETAGIKQTPGTGAQSPLTGQTIIKGVPNWVVIGGAAVLGVVLANR
jgi:hypothetical protein